MTSILESAFETTAEGKICYNITDTIAFLTKIKDEIEKILKGTNPNDNRNRLLVLYQDIITKITSIQTYEVLTKRIPAKISEEKTKKIQAIEEKMPVKSNISAPAADGRYLNQKRIAHKINTLPLSPRSRRYDFY